MYEVDTALRRVGRRTNQVDSTVCETGYKKNGDTRRLLDNISPTKPVNRQFGE